MSDEATPMRFGRRRVVMAGLAAAGGMAVRHPAGFAQAAPGAADLPQPPSAPMLLPATVSHTGPVRTVAVSRDGALVATAGVDRSVRLWDSATSRMLHRWYPPLGDGATGIVDAVDFSPDGKLLFVAAVDWVGEPRTTVYVMDALNGAMRRIISSRGGSPWRCQDLACSPSGGLFAMAAEQRGVVVLRYDANLGIKPAYVDQRAPGDLTTGVAFSGDGSLLAVVSRRGVLRVFRVGGEVVEQPQPLRTPFKGSALSVAFSADGRRVAVGFDNQRGVAVVDLANGQTATLEPPASLGPGNAGLVAWAGGEAGEEWLFAAGTLQQPGAGNLMFAWRNGQPGVPVAAECAQDSVAAVTANPAGGVVFGSSDAAWGGVVVRHTMLHPAAARLGVSLNPTERLDFREVGRRRWGIDRSGAVVEFQGMQRGQPALRIDLRRLSLDEFGARVPRPDLRIPGRGPVVKLPGNLLRDKERVLSSDASVAGITQGRIVLIGTEEQLLLLSDSGQEIGRQVIATPAWGVAISGDSRVAVVAHGDGTLRWYGLDPAAPLHPLGGLFVHVDRRRWIAWRNDGHFAYSEFGGETLAGLHQNGRHTSDPATLTSRWMLIDEQFQRLYDPAAIKTLIDPGRHWLPRPLPALQEIERDRDTAIPIRVIEICPSDPPSEPSRRTRMIETLEGVPDSPAAASPAGSGQGACQDLTQAAAAGRASTAELPYGTQAFKALLDLGGSGQQVMVDAFVNGVNAGRAFHMPGSKVERIVPLGQDDATVEFRVHGPTGAFTRSGPVVITRAAAPSPVPATEPPASRLHVLAVGIDRYTGTVPALRYAVADAMTFGDTIRRVWPRTYTTLAEPIALKDEYASVTGVQNAMIELALRAKPGDAVMIYMSGHGVSVGGQYAFVTQNVQDGNAAVDHAEGCLKSETLIELLSNIVAARCMLLLDTCFANSIDLQLGGRLGHDSGQYVLTASGRDQGALDGYKDGHGVFGYAVKEALTTSSATTDGVMDALQFGVYVRDRVRVLAEERRHEQDSHFQVRGEAVKFPVAEFR